MCGNVYVDNVKKDLYMAETTRATVDNPVDSVD